MRGTYFAALLLLAGSAGCTIIKTTDVTDASYKRHHSVAVLGWPIYSRVTDRERGSATHLATKIEGVNQTDDVQAAELLPQTIEPARPIPVW